MIEYMNMAEVNECTGWFTIPGHCSPGGATYKINRLGSVVTSVGRLLTPRTAAGYPAVNVYKDGLIYPRTIHRLLALTFIPNPKNLPEVDHRDRNKLNNDLDNLRWVSHSQNMLNRSSWVHSGRSGKGLTIYWPSGSIDYLTTKEAAQALGKDPATVRYHLRQKDTAVISGLKVSRTNSDS